MMRFGYVIRIGGDADIAEALRDGVEKGTPSVRRSLTAPSEREPLGPMAGEALRRVAMQRHTPEELREMIFQARVDYAQRYHGALYHRAWQALGLMWMIIDATFRRLQAWNREA